MTIPFPERRADAPGGAAFLASLADMKLSARQEAMAAALLAGDVPARLRRFVEVTLTRRGHTAALRVAPDFLLIGSDEDFVTAPLRALVAQRVADALGCVVPTRPLVDAVLAAGAKAPLVGMWRKDAPDGWLESWRCHRDHQARIQRPAAPAGALVAGYLKDVVLTPSLQKKVARNRRWPVAIYGAWDASKGKVVQGLVRDHAIDYVDLQPRDAPRVGRHDARRRRALGRRRARRPRPRRSALRRRRHRPRALRAREVAARRAVAA